ncbi:MAG: GatB/YqeY domain-containing protein [Patescibacteria group bacterium]
MKTSEQIEQDLKKAQKAKDEVSLTTLRMLKSALHNQEISLKQKELKDGEVLKVVATEVKKHKDSIEAYRQGERGDLAKKEEVELAILEKYLPEQLGDEEIRRVVAEILDKNPELKDPKAFGKVMSQVMAQLKGQADGQIVNQIVKELINS